MNAANEVAVEAFLKKKIGFLDIPNVIENTLVKSAYLKAPVLEDYIESDRQARLVANELI